MSLVSTQTICKATSQLSDGREIVYFDESPGTGRAGFEDTRGLAIPTWQPPEIRWDPLLGENVVIAAQRQDRTFLPPADECPLDPSGPGRATEIPAPDYDVVVFENRFPSLRAPHGRCEVMCFTSDHGSSFASLTPLRVRTVMEAWIDRTVALGAMPEVAQVYCFENRGEEIGVTLSHPHGQIYGYPYLTPRTAAMLQQAAEHRDVHGGNLFADLLAREVHDGSRIVARTDMFTAFVPFAARWPVEVHIYPNRFVHNLLDLAAAELDDFARIYLDILRRFDRMYSGPLPYISALHQFADTDAQRDGYFHVELMSIRRSAGALKYLAASESAMDAFISDVTPETVAERLRGLG